MRPLPRARAVRPPSWAPFRLRAALLSVAMTASFAAAVATASSAAASSDGAWAITTTQFVNRFDAEPYVGNGYFSQRIPAAGMGFLAGLGTVGWPLMQPRTTEALAAGLYAQMHASNFYPDEDRQVIARLPTWSTLSFSAPGGDTYAPDTVTASQISDYQQTSDLRTATVTTSGIWTSRHGRRARFSYTVFTDRARRHVGLVSLSLTPLWNGRTSVTALLDGRGASRLRGVAAGVDRKTGTSYVSSQAIGTGFRDTESATLRFTVARAKTAAVGSSRTQTAGERISFVAHRGHTYRFTKYVAVVTSRDSKHPAAEARTESMRASSLGRAVLEKENAGAWSGIWQGAIDVSGDPALQTAIRANTRDLYASIRPGLPDAIGPSGLSSDGYAGMIFWDSDIWMFPAILAAHPGIARVAVDYRARTLNAARANARANGYRGALYAWTAGDDGHIGHDCYGTVTAGDHIVSDPNKSCSEELHLQGDIAVAQWEYYQATGDKTWLRNNGWPVLRALANFWVSKAKPSSGGGYSIDKVQPPDESHTDVNNSTYTNAVAATALRDATRAARVVGARARAIWRTVADGLTKTMPFNASQGIYEEFDGYEGDQIKQADVVMLTYPLQFPMPAKVGLNDLNYYAPRTNPQGPAMTDAIHSIDASALHAPGCAAYHYMQGSYQPFLRGPFDQFAETRPGNPETAFNFFTGVGGFLQVFQYGFSGLRYATNAVHLDPSLPQQLRGITLNNLRWHGRVFTVAITPTSTVVHNKSRAAMPVVTPAGTQTVPPGGAIAIPTRLQTCG